MRLHIIAPTYNPRVVAGAGLTLVKLTTRLFDRFPEAKIYLNAETAKAFPDWRERLVTVNCGEMGRPIRKAVATARLQLFGFPEFPRDGVCWFPFGPMMPLQFAGNGVATIHDTLDLDRPASVPMIERFFRGIMMPRTARRTEVVTISQFSRQRLQHHFGIRSRVIEWGIDPMGDGSDAMVPKRPYAFYPANAYAHKNHRFLLDLWEREPRLRGFPLVLTVGSGTRPLDEAIGRARAAGAEIVVTGRVRDDELAGLYRNALCTLLPTFYEGYGLPMREALLCNCPILANADCAALRETVRDDYPHFLPLDPVCWTNAILSMRDRDRSGLSEYVVPSSWEECADQYADVFREIGEITNLVAA